MAYFDWLLGFNSFGFDPQACRDFLALAQAHSKRWQKALQAERDQRVRLEETLEQLAKQHNNLERAFRGAAQANATADNKSKMWLWRWPLPMLGYGQFLNLFFCPLTPPFLPLHSGNFQGFYSSLPDNCCQQEGCVSKIFIFKRKCLSWKGLQV